MLALDSTHASPHALDDGTFAAAFERFVVRGYEEEGTTTTPFDMVARNHMSRHHFAIDVLRATRGSESLVLQHEKALAQHRATIRTTGMEPAEISGWRWTAS